MENEELIKLEYEEINHGFDCSAYIEENGKFICKVRGMGGTKELARIHTLHLLSKWLRSRLEHMKGNELPGGWYTDNECLWCGDSEKDKAPLRLNFGSGDIQYDNVTSNPFFEQNPKEDEEEV